MHYGLGMVGEQIILYTKASKFLTIVYEHNYLALLVENADICPEHFQGSRQTGQKIQWKDHEVCQQLSAEQENFPRDGQAGLCRFSDYTICSENL